MFERFKAKLDSRLDDDDFYGGDSAPQPVAKLKPNVSKAWLRDVKRRLLNSS